MITGIKKEVLNIKKINWIFLLFLLFINCACFSKNANKINRIVSEKSDIKIGETTQLKYINSEISISPEDLTWVSRDTSVATVDKNGKLTAAKRGYTTITVFSNNGGNASLEFNIVEEVNLQDISRNKLMVVLAFGQSIASNTGIGKYLSNDNVFNLDSDGKVYRAQDPMKWADGVNGSVWSRLGDKIIDEKGCENVIFITIGVGGTPISRWSREGDLNKSKLIPALKKAKDMGLTITHVLWHQGSSDVGNSKEYYVDKFNGIVETIRNEGAMAPIYVSIHSGDGDYPHNSEINKNKRNQIRDAQKALINNKDIFQGPNTDEEITLESRQEDKLHFNEIGNEEFAELWIKCIKSNTGF